MKLSGTVIAKGIRKGAKMIEIDSNGFIFTIEPMQGEFDSVDLNSKVSITGKLAKDTFKYSTIVKES